jgi:hypothetical protein
VEQLLLWLMALQWFMPLLSAEEAVEVVAVVLQAEHLLVVLEQVTVAHLAE